MTNPPLYTITRTCSSGPTTQRGPTEPNFFNTGGPTGGRYKLLPFDTRKLEAEHRGGSTYPETWSWELS